MNSFKSKILFRCDAGYIPEIGAGHLYRCLTIAKFLKKKFKLRNQNIIFIVKVSNKFSLAKKIIENEKFNFFGILNHKIKNYSEKELKIINKFSSRLIIIDRLDKISKNFILKLRNNYKKIILLDDASNNRKYADLTLNPTILNVKRINNCKVGYKYNIIPSILHKRKAFKKKIDGFFLFFGGFDKNNYTKKIGDVLLKLNISSKIFINSDKKLLFEPEKRKKILFFKKKDHFKTLLKSKYIISAGGLGMFDGIALNKHLICIPQYNHQKKNINNLEKRGAIIKLEPKNKKKMKKLFSNLLKNKINLEKLKKNQKKILNFNHVKNNLLKISAVYEKN